MLLWVAAATAIAQVIAWTMEAVRRGPHGIVVVRALAVSAILLGLLLHLSGQLTSILDQIPTVWFVVVGSTACPGAGRSPCFSRWRCW